MPTDNKAQPKKRALAIYLGREAARRIAKDGWTPDLFELLLGASGGAKWLILGHLDRVLFGEFLARGTRPLEVIGSSIGAWRNACLAMPDPAAAIDRFEAGYLEQRYRSKPTPQEVSSVSRSILDRMLAADGVDHLLHHPRFHTHIVTARGRGPAGSSSNAVLASTMGSAALGNAVSRKLLRLHFQRVVFHTGSTAQTLLHTGDFATAGVPLREDNLKQALHASGSIPFVLTGERNIGGGPPGQYWDGGIIDYHFDLSGYTGEGLVLYPHFSANVIPGWFDKFLPWRRSNLALFNNLVMLCPREDFIASLPYGKIPDRSDFTRLPEQERLDYWQTCIARSRALAEDFADLVSGPDPLAGAVIL